MSASGEPEARLAILIDADNTPYDSIPSILDRSHKFGRAIIRRAYGDWSKTQLKSWSLMFREYAVKPIQQFQFTTGKNSTDSAMTIDAMDILNEGRVDVFMLVTSDSDFTGLATRIREQGLRVIGVGREITPPSFVKGCDEFLLIENLIRDSKIVAREQVEAKALERSKTGQEGSGVEIATLLTKAVLNVVDENGNVLGSELGAMLRKLDPKFTPQNYGATKLGDLIAKHPEILKKTAKRSGVDVIYQALVSH